MIEERRGRGEARAGRDDRRADERQHRRRPGDRRGAQGLPAASSSCRTRSRQEKIALLRAFGAEVVICPTAVEPESPESYYSVADRLAEEIPDAYKPNQYSNPAKPAGALRDDRPGDLGADRAAKLDALVLAVGTGGTITGAGSTSRSRSPDLQVVGADPEGSIYSSETVHPVPRRGHRRGLLARRPSTRRSSTST